MGIVQPETLCQSKISKHAVGNWTRSLPACSSVLRPNVRPRTTEYMGGIEKRIQILVRKPEEKKTLSRRDAPGKIIIKRKLKKKSVWSGFFWSRTGTTDGLLVNKVAECDCHIRRRIFWQLETATELCSLKSSDGRWNLLHLGDAKKA